MLKNNTSSEVIGDSNNINIAKRDINILHNTTNIEPRPSNIQRFKDYSKVLRI